MLASTSGLRALGLGCLALGVVLAVWFGYQRSSLERPSAFQLLDWIDKAEFIANQLKVSIARGLDLAIEQPSNASFIEVYHLMTQIAATSCSVRLDLTSAGLDANTQETLAQGVLSARIALSPPIEDGPCVWTTIRVECAGRTCVPERVWSGKPCWVADRPLRNLDVSLRVVTDSVAESKGAGNHPDGVPCVSGIRAAAGEADISLEVLLSPGGGCASEAVPAARSLSAAAATACGAATAFWGSLPPVPRPGRHTAAALHTSTVQRHVEVVATLVLPKTETAQPGFNRSPQRAQQCSAHLRALAALDLQRELEAAIDPFAGAFPGVHLQARVKSLDFLPGEPLLTLHRRVSGLEMRALRDAAQPYSSDAAAMVQYKSCLQRRSQRARFTRRLRT